MEEIVDAQFTSLVDEELNVLIRDYSIPHVAELGRDSLLAQSQYAKVIFHDIADTYPTDADICCRYSLTSDVTVSDGDRIAMYRVGWSSVQEHIVFEFVPVTDATERQILFKASSLPKDEDEFYQLCYVTAKDMVCGASVPFQFRHPHENELCAVEEVDGMMVVRSRTAFTEEKLREAHVANELLQKEKGNLEKELKILEGKYNKVSVELHDVTQKLSMLETEKQALEEKLEDNLHMKHHVEQLLQDLLAADREKNQSLAKLIKAEQHIEILTATVDTLSADKEHMAQLLRSETQKSSDVTTEISQFKVQVDSLTHMLEALTKSKELVTQELQVQLTSSRELREHIQCLEMECREQRNKIAELQKEKKMIEDLLQQALSTENNSEDKMKRINDLEKENECLLSELVQSASKKENELKLITEVHEERLKEVTNKAMAVERDLCTSKREADEIRKDIIETAQVNKCLKQQLQEAQSIISEKEYSLTQITHQKGTLETDLKNAVESQKKLVEHNEHLTTRITELEDDLASLKLQLQEHVGKVYLRELLRELKHNKNIQLERIDAITKRLKELDIEERNLHCERQEVAAILDTQEKKLADTVDNLKSLVERQRKNHLMESDPVLNGDSDIEMLKETITEVKLFMESSKMRICEIDKQMKEIEDEKSVLMQQQSHALERMNEYKKYEEEVQQKLMKLKEHEDEIVKKHGCELEMLQPKLDCALNQNSKMLATGIRVDEKFSLTKKEKIEPQQKLEENSSSKEQLELRLQLAAEEYRKLYTEKQKMERRLAKVYHKRGDRKAKSSSALEQSEASRSEAREQPVTGELISLTCTTELSSKNNTALPSQEKGGPSFCSVASPPGTSDIMQHFDAYLS